MKAFDSLEKDSLILLSILNEDLPTLMKALAKTQEAAKIDNDFSFSSAFPKNSPHSVDLEEDNNSQSFSQNMVYMHGVAHKMDLDFDGTRKYFKSELKSLITPEQWSALTQFFETFTDKVSMTEEEHKKTIIYATTFAYRFLYNLYFLSYNPNSVEGEAEEDNAYENQTEDEEENKDDYTQSLMPGFNPKILNNVNKKQPQKPSLTHTKLSPKEKIQAVLTDLQESNPSNNPSLVANASSQALMSSKNISILKSLVAPGQDTFVQKSFVEMSEIFYYMPNLKSLGLHFDDFREALTHGITGCFLLEEDNEKKSLALTKDLTLEEFFKTL